MPILKLYGHTHNPHSSKRGSSNYKHKICKLLLTGKFATITLTNKSSCTVVHLPKLVQTTYIIIIMLAFRNRSSPQRILCGHTTHMDLSFSNYSCRHLWRNRTGSVINDSNKMGNIQNQEMDLMKTPPTVYCACAVVRSVQSRAEVGRGSSWVVGRIHQSWRSMPVHLTVLVYYVSFYDRYMDKRLQCEFTCAWH